MKSNWLFMLLFFSLAIFAAEEDRSTIPVATNTSINDLTFSNTTALAQHSEFELFKQCSVSSSGVVQTEHGFFTFTITVTGPCNASLAQKMRDAIAILRAAVK